MAIDPQQKALHEVFVELSAVRRCLTRFLSNLTEAQENFAEIGAAVTKLGELANQVPPAVKSEVQGILASQSVKMLVQDTTALANAITTYQNKWGDQ